MTDPMKATVVAHPNVALVKYWGKRDARLILPYQSSLSVTVAPLSVRTTVEFRPTLRSQRDDAAAKGQEGRKKIFDGLLQRLDEEAS